MKNPPHKSIVLDTFDGHIVLLCKEHYIVNAGAFLSAIKRVWAIRCGIDYNTMDDDCWEYIADQMYGILTQCVPSKMCGIQKEIHKSFASPKLFQTPENLTPIQMLIWEYRGKIHNLQILQEDVNGKCITLISLPKPQYVIFRQIVWGRGKFEHEEIIRKLDKRKELLN